MGIVGGFFGGVAAGGVSGTVVGTGVSNAVGEGVREKVPEKHKRAGSFAGTVLGLLSGAASGIGVGALSFATAEIAGFLYGASHGVGMIPGVDESLTAQHTECSRVGFKKYVDGEKVRPPKNTYGTDFGKPMYGLKKLRAWMARNAGWKDSQVLDEIRPGDEDAVQHCERVREHTFDLRHATACVSHSELCGGPAFVMPATLAKLAGGCPTLSSLDQLEKMAVAFGDDPKTGMFAQWRKMQEKIREENGFDGERAQCIRTLCEYGGWKKASLKLHPDKLVNKPEDERTMLSNIFKFLSKCKTDQLDDEGKALTLDKAEDRETHCSEAEASSERLEGDGSGALLEEDGSGAQLEEDDLAAELAGVQHTQELSGLVRSHRDNGE